MHDSNDVMNVVAKQAKHVTRFGEYELNCQTGELVGSGRKVRLGEKPLQALIFLIESAGEVVTREKLCRRLWPSGTFVEFDDNLNATIKRLREALRDSAEHPTFIETIPRLGYRFIAARTIISPDSTDSEKSGAFSQPVLESVIAVRKWLIAVSLSVIAVTIGAFYLHRQAAPKVAHPASIRLGIVGFTNATGKAEQDFLANGLSELLTARLRRLAPVQLTVISDLDSDGAAGRGGKATDEAQRLAVDYLLDGTLEQTGDELQLVTTLTKNGSQRIWTTAYRVPLQETFVEDDIARRIANTFSLNLQPQTRRDLSRINTADTSAYDHYMRGLYALHLDRIDSLRESIKWFEQAVQEDPEYAPPHAGLAQAYLRLGELSAIPLQEAAKNAKQHIELGMNLDPSLPVFYSLRAGMLASLPGSFEQSVRLYRRAIQLEPQNPESYVQYALFLRERRPNDALGEINLALQLEPRSAWVNACVGWVLISAERFDDADRQLKTALELDPMQPATMRFLGLLEQKRGRIDRSTFWFEKAASTSRRNPYYIYRLALAYAKSGRIDRVQELLNELRTRAKREPVDPRYIRVLNAALSG